MDGDLFREIPSLAELTELEAAAKADYSAYGSHMFENAGESLAGENFEDPSVRQGPLAQEANPFSTRSAFPLNSSDDSRLGPALSDLNRGAKARAEALVNAEDYRDRIESDLNRFRGKPLDQVRDVQEQVHILTERLREKDEQITFLVEKSKRFETQGSGDAADLREQLNESHLRYTRTIEQYKDLYRTCEQELYLGEQKRAELQRDFDKLLRGREQSAAAVKQYAELYHQAERQLLEAEKRRIALQRRISELEAGHRLAQSGAAGHGLAAREELSKVGHGLQEVCGSVKDFLERVSQGGQGFTSAGTLKAGKILAEQMRLDIEVLMKLLGERPSESPLPPTRNTYQIEDVPAVAGPAEIARLFAPEKSGR